MIICYSRYRSMIAHHFIHLSVLCKFGKIIFVCLRVSRDSLHISFLSVIMKAGCWRPPEEAQRNVCVRTSWRTFEREELWSHRERRRPDWVNMLQTLGLVQCKRRTSKNPRLWQNPMFFMLLYISSERSCCLRGNMFAELIRKAHYILKIMHPACKLLHDTEWGIYSTY